jgi:hypothetical protein
MKKNKELNKSTAFKTNGDESAEDFFKQAYGPERIHEIIIRSNWGIRADLKEIMEFLNKANNLERIKYIVDERIFHNRGLRIALNKYKLQYNKADLLDSLVDLGLLRAEKFFAPNVRSRRVFIYSLVTVPEEERLAYLMPFLSKTALENLKSERGE